MWNKIVHEWHFFERHMKFWFWWGCMPYWLQWFTVELMRG